MDIKNSSLATGLQAYWDFQEASGTRYDLVGSKDLTDNNTVTSAAGKIGNAADFEADNSEYFTTTDAAAVRIDDGWSISCWFYLESAHPSGNGWSRILHYQRSGENGVGCGVYNDGATPKFAVMTGSGSFGHTLGSGNTINTGQWYHVVVYFNGASTKVYINGAAADTYSCNAITAPNTTFHIGRDHAGSQHWDGLIEEFGIWNRELTSSDVASLYNSGSGIAYYAPASVSGDTTLTTSLTSYWEMEETSGTRVDSHGNNDLTDNNTVLSGTGINNTGADFESANSEYLSIADGSQTGLDNLTNASFAFWVRLESDTDPVVLGKFATGSASYWIQIQLTTAVKFQDSTETDSCVITQSDLTLSTWYHMVFTYAAGVVKLYVNGVYVGTDTTTNTTLPNTTGYFSIGRVEKYNSNYFDGLMDEVAVWGKALTVGEVRALYGYGDAPPYSGATNVTVSGTVQSSAFTIPAYTVTPVALCTPSAQVATFSVPTYEVISGNVTITPNSQDVAFTVPAHSVSAGAIVMPDGQSLTFSVPSYAIALSIAVTPSTVTLTFVTPTLAKVGAVWTKRGRSTNATWARTSRNST